MLPAHEGMPAVQHLCMHTGGKSKLVAPAPAQAPPPAAAQAASAADGSAAAADRASKYLVDLSLGAEEEEEEPKSSSKVGWG